MSHVETATAVLSVYMHMVQIGWHQRQAVVALGSVKTLQYCTCYCTACAALMYYYYYYSVSSLFTTATIPTATAVTAIAAICTVSTLALFLPVHIASYNLASNKHVLIMSRGAAIFMLLMYVQLMVFQLKTHAHIYVEADEPPAIAAAAAKQVSLQQLHTLHATDAAYMT
jgi:hypothetical protein